MLLCQTCGISSAHMRWWCCLFFGLKGEEVRVEAIRGAVEARTAQREPNGDQ